MKYLATLFGGFDKKAGQQYETIVVEADHLDINPVTGGVMLKDAHDKTVGILPIVRCILPNEDK